ncbi:MAG: hypothetical protein ACM3ZQ_05225, partial [Bacillota bacterium]
MATSERSGVAIPASVASSWGISSDSLIWVEVGQRKVATHPLVQADCNLEISPQMREALLLPKGMTLSCYFNKERQTLRIGPAIGVIVDRTRSGSRPFGAQTALLQEIGRLAEQV